MLCYRHRLCRFSPSLESKQCDSQTAFFSFTYIDFSYEGIPAIFIYYLNFSLTRSSHFLDFVDNIFFNYT